jgi:ribonuclease VapC
MKACVIDTSALVAMVLGEPEASVFARKLVEYDCVWVCSATVLEARLVIWGRKGEAGIHVLAQLLKRPMFAVTAPAMAETDIAYDAAKQYGKGNGHPAQLNFGDLFSYATAKSRGLPLLYKGHDFAQTDLELA